MNSTMVNCSGFSFLEMIILEINDIINGKELN